MAHGNTRRRSEDLPHRRRALQNAQRMSLLGLNEPRKRDLQAMLAEAAANTAEEDPRIEEFVRAVSALHKGRRH